MNDNDTLIEVSPPFSKFAPYYDQFMIRYVNYPMWIDYLIKIFNHFDFHPYLILDLACGTGIPSLILAQKGYRVIGIDNSLEMLAVLKNKLNSKKFDITTIQSDIRNFTVSEKVDCAISIYDSINYLSTEQDLQSCFCCVSKALRTGGFFIFDLNTIYCLETFWDNHKTSRKVNDIYTLWQSSYDPSKRISTLRLKVSINQNIFFEEVHLERGYTVSEIAHCLQSTGFTDIKFYEHLTFLPPTEVTMRMMVVAKRK